MVHWGMCAPSRLQQFLWALRLPWRICFCRSIASTVDVDGVDRDVCCHCHRLCGRIDVALLWPNEACLRVVREFDRTYHAAVGFAAIVAFSPLGYLRVLECSFARVAFAEGVSDANAEFAAVDGLQSLEPRTSGRVLAAVDCCVLSAGAEDAGFSLAFPPAFVLDFRDGTLATAPED